MSRSVLFSLFLFTAIGAVIGSQLETVADFGWDSQPTGIAVSEGGRIFVSFPRWFTNFTGPSVVEVTAKDGTTAPYPNEDLNSWSQNDPDDSGGVKFVCIQSVFVDHFDRLWILDAGNAYLGTAIMNGEAPNIVVGAPKLVLVNMTTNEVVKTIHFDLDVAPMNSYVNDVRITVDGNHAILSDSNMGGIKVIDLTTGEGRVLLADHPSTHSEDDTLVTVEGQGMLLTSGDAAAFQSDGIAIIENTLYYHAVTARSLYKINIELLTDSTKTEEEVESGVTFVCYSGMPDGMVLAGDEQLRGTLYMTAVEKDGVDYLSSDGFDRVLPFVSDPLLQWPDSLAVPVMRSNTNSSNVNDNYLYVTASQVNSAPFIKDAKPRRNTYQLYRVKLPVVTPLVRPEEL